MESKQKDAPVKEKPETAKAQDQSAAKTDAPVAQATLSVATPAPKAAEAPKPAPSTDSPEVAKLREQIGEEKKNRIAAVEQLSSVRNKLRYKQAESEALSRLSSLNHVDNNVGRLKRMKADLEFKIATEATTLNAEKELIKKLTTINDDLEDALRTYRFRRKAELVAQDVSDLTKKFELCRDQIKESDGKLDVLYSSLRELVSRTRRPYSDSGQRRPPRPFPKQEPLEISLEDIATIKSKKPSGGDESAGG